MSPRVSGGTNAPGPLGHVSWPIALQQGHKAARRCDKERR